MAARLLAFPIIALIAVVAIGCGGGSGEPEATATPAPTVAPTLPPELEGFSITLERTSCFGSCPDYAVTVEGDGSVTYDGRLFVAVEGAQTASVPVADVLRLAAKVEEIDYFAIEVDTVDSPGVCQAVDGPGYTTAVTLGERQREIIRCPGIESPEDLLLAELEDLVDEVAGTSRWVEGEEP